MNRVLIFSASTGGGHNIAANSLKEQFEISGFHAVIYDAFKETSTLLHNVMSKGYEKMINITPRTYGKLYKAANNKTISHYIIAILTEILENRILDIINSENPDLIVVTHPLVTNVLGTLKGDKEFNTPIISIVTDYMIHTAYINENINAYVVGSDYTKKRMVEMGVCEDIVYPYGIPVRKSFLDYSKSANKDKDEEVDLSILLMGGSMGVTQLEDALWSLLKTKHFLKIVVVCGNNHKMKNRIEKTAAVNTMNKIEVHGFVHEMSELMDQVDLIITKPGGLTTTEAIIKNIPMLIPYYIPGQEEENADFLVATGMAIKVRKISEISTVVDYLVSNKDLLDNMADTMSEIAQKQSIENIIELGKDLIKRPLVT